MALATFDKRNPAPYFQDANGNSLKPLGSGEADFFRLISPEIQFTALTGLVTTNTIDVLDIPKGMQIKDAYILTTEALAGATAPTLALNTVGNVAASTSAKALLAAATPAAANATIKGAGANIGDVTTAEEVVRATVAFSGGAFTAGKFRVMVDLAKVNSGQ